MQRFAVTVAASSLVLIAAQAFAQQDQDIPEGLRPAPTVITDAGALRALFEERTLHGHFSSGDTFIEYYRADGVSAYWQLGCMHEGQWWIEPLDAPEDTLAAGTATVCFSYPTLNDDGEPACFVVGGPVGRERFYALGPPLDASLPTATVDSWSPGNSEPLPVGQSYCPSS